MKGQVGYASVDQEYIVMQRYFRFLLVGTLSLFSLLACRSITLSPSTLTLQPTITPHEIPSTGRISPSLAPDIVSQEETLVRLYEEASKGVVAIRVLTESGDSLGSGFVLDMHGYILTNYHVVEGVADLEVNFSSGLKVRGEVIGIDLDSDLAVIKANAPPEALHPLPLGDSEQVKVGQTVVAIGVPFDLNGTMTLGIISAVGRTLGSMRAYPGGHVFEAGDLIQTDAAINPGNSGGPLINLNGEVIGVNRAIRTESFSADGPINSGIGFAISINIAKRVVPSLIAHGKYDYPFLGISGTDEIRLVEQEALNLPRSTGVYVTEIVPGSPADRAGLRIGTRPSSISGMNSGGDLIIAINGNEVRNFSEMLSYLLNHTSPGDVIKMTVLRDGKEMEVELTLGSRP
jgi:S1-C subfamily serine protease